MLAAACYADGQVFQHFGQTPEFMTYTIEDGKVTAKAPLSTGGAGHAAASAAMRSTSCPRRASRCTPALPVRPTRRPPSSLRARS